MVCRIGNINLIYARSITVHQQKSIVHQFIFFLAGKLFVRRLVQTILKTLDLQRDLQLVLSFSMNVLQNFDDLRDPCTSSSKDLNENYYLSI